MDLGKPFRKHQFDMSKPVVTEISITIGTGEPFKMTLPCFICSNCGKALYLDRRDMRNLPWEMARGCPKKVKKA